MVNRYPKAKRVHGVKGIHQAHIAAAKLVTTHMFWVVDGDAIVEDVTEIVKYDPRINAESILVDEYEHGILVEVSIRYNNNSQVESMRFMFDQNQNSVAYSAA